jgi:hypothetical protein
MEMPAISPTISCLPYLPWSPWAARHKLYLHGKLSMIMPATATRNSHYCTCIDHLGRCNINRNDPICVMLPLVAKVSTVTWLWRVAVTNSFANKCCQCKWSIMILSVSLCSSWLRKARKALSHCNIAGIIEYKLGQCTRAFKLCLAGNDVSFNG